MISKRKSKKLKTGGKIMEKLEKQVNELLSTPTEENLKNFINEYDGQVFALRDYKQIAQEFVDEYSNLKSMLYANDPKEMLEIFFDSDFRYDEKMLVMYGSYEDGLNIYESARYYWFVQWKDGAVLNDVYVLK